MFSLWALAVAETGAYARGNSCCSGTTCIHETALAYISAIDAGAVHTGNPQG